MKDVNAIITNADVHFFPELDANQIELTLQFNKGNGLLRVPMCNDSMYSIYNLFNKNSIKELNGQYCRVIMDELTGRIDGIKNIIYDDRGELQDNPVA